MPSSSQRLSFTSQLLLTILFVILLTMVAVDLSEHSNGQHVSKAFSFMTVEAYRVKSTTDPSFECSGCARTRLIGCFNGQCRYRCYRSCTNGTSVVIEAHRFVLEGQRRRRKRYLTE